MCAHPDQRKENLPFQQRFLEQIGQYKRIYLWGIANKKQINTGENKEIIISNQNTNNKMIFDFKNAYRLLQNPKQLICILATLWLIEEI